MAQNVPETQNVPVTPMVPMPPMPPMVPMPPLVPVAQMAPIAAAKVVMPRATAHVKLHPNHHIMRKLVLLGAATGVAALLYKLFNQNNYKYPPGPLALPCIGTLYVTGTKNIYMQIQELSEKYKDALTIWMGIKAMVIINTPELAREALIRDVFTDIPGKPYVWEAPFEVVGQANPNVHATITATIHQIAEAATEDYLFGKRADIILNAVFQEFQKRVTKHKRKPQDILPEITLMIYSFLHKVFFRTSVTDKEQFFTQSLEFHRDLRTHFMRGGPVDVFRWNPINYRYNSEHEHKLQDVSNFYRQYFTDQFARQNKDFQNDNIRHLTDELISYWHKVSEQHQREALIHLSPEHFVHLIGDVFYAASHTARILLTNIIGYMCAYEDVQTKMQEELENVLGIDGVMSFDSHINLPYTEAVIKEVSRMASIKPLTEYETTSDTHFGEYFIPKNTSVCINQWGIHHNPKYFPSPDQFLPERWLDQQGRFVHHPNDIEPSMFRRFCLGEHISKIEVYVLTGMIFKNFRFKAGPEQQVPPPSEEVLGTLEMESMFVIASARKTTAV